MPDRYQRSFFERHEDVFMVACIVAMLAAVFACIAAWATHVIICIKTASWLLLVAGAVAFPVGIVNGFGIWFGLL
jgi:hypothetical protein